MPKHYDLISLASTDITQSIEEPIENPNYFLFMLGTDTVYTHRPTPNEWYENGETLSYMAQVVAHELGETNAERAADNPLSFSTPSVDVVNGPTTLGSEVGQRIAQGVLLILKAVAEGKRNIQISGHSRGAVESILIAHELERIKTQLSESPSLSLREILANTECQLTKRAFNKYGDAQTTIDFRNNLCDALNNTNINLFLIDPVPGGRVLIPGTEWRDERFYVRPPCNNVELLIARDERTAPFTPIIPHEITPLIIPGHHGTASGIQCSQQRAALPLELISLNTSDAQKLLVHKMLGFFNDNTQLFNYRPIDALSMSSSFVHIDEQDIRLEHPELDKITDGFIYEEVAAERQKQRLALYDEIFRNNAAYAHFRTTSYSHPFLGNAQSETGTRLVHYRNNQMTALDTVVAGLNGHFVNREHAHLYLHEAIGFDFNEREGLVESMGTLGDALSNLFVEYTSSDKNHHRTQELFNDPATRANTFSALSVFIDRISQHYLRNHLDVQVKTALLKAIRDTFALVETFRKEPGAGITSIVDDCMAMLQIGIKNTADTHHSNLSDQLNALRNRTKHFIASSKDIEDTYREFKRKIFLDPNLNRQHALSIDKFIQDIEESGPITIEHIKQIFVQRLPELSADAAQIVLTHATNSEGALNLFNLINSETQNEEDILLQLNILKNNIMDLHDGYNTVTRLAARGLGFTQKSLEQQREEVIGLGNEITNKLQKENATKAHIEQELIPLTKQYLSHLKKQADLIDPCYINNRETNQATRGTPELESIGEKYFKLKDAMRHLTDIESIPIPSQRVSRFTDDLSRINNTLKAHRDPEWVRYFKACMVTIAVICTGIIPGLIALSAYATYTKSSPLFFTQSHGARYLNQIEAITPSIAG